MEFFNKKQDVLDLQLTQYGRHLLSRGLFKPKYYSFHDDNVMYNISSSGPGANELQHETQSRIKLTPTMRPQVGYSSLAEEFGNNYEKILSGEAKVGAESLQRTAEKNYLLSPALGTSDVNSEFAPSWDVDFLNGQISSSAATLTLEQKSGGKHTLNIPQIESEIEIKVIDSTGNEGQANEDGTDADTKFSIISDDEDMFVLLRVHEQNGVFQIKNFDIEVFEIETTDKSGMVLTGSTANTNTAPETLRPLSFSLFQEPESEVDFVDDVLPENNKTHVEYYMDILVDEEIDDEILCKYDPVSKKMGVFSDPKTKLCIDIEEDEKKVFDIYKEGSDDPGEPC